MMKTKKYAIITFLTLFLISTAFVKNTYAQNNYQKLFVTESTDNFSEYISDEVNKYVLDNYEDIISCTNEYREIYDLNKNDLNSFKIGEPFCIMNLNSSNQEEVYYYPILNSNNKVILVLTVMNTNYSIQMCLDNELVNVLNEIDYYNNDYIFYEENDILTAQGENGHNYCEDDSYKQKYTYDELHNLLMDSVLSMDKVNVLQNTNPNINLEVKEGYTPTYSSNINDTNLKEKLLSLHNPKGQGNFGRCWAASVATIANYIKGRNLSAKRVCDDMNIGYNTGGSIADKQTALRSYEVYYNKIRYRTLKWSEIRENINKKRPIAVSASAPEGWHAVTIVGYRSFKVNQYIAIWDSASNNGKGIMKIINYLGDYTTFQSSSIGPTFTWEYSLSKY